MDDMILYGMVVSLDTPGTPKIGLKKQHDLTLWLHVVSILTPAFLPTLLHHPCSSFYIVMLREQMNTERTHDSVIVRMNMGSSKTLGSWQHQEMCLPPCCRFASRARTTQPHSRWWLQNSTAGGWMQHLALIRSQFRTLVPTSDKLVNSAWFVIATYCNISRNAVYGNKLAPYRPLPQSVETPLAATHVSHAICQYSWFWVSFS